MGELMQSNEAIHSSSIEHETPLTIGEMARHYGVTLRALRFYEDRGLLHPARVGTARYYDSTTRARLEVVLKGKQLGFTLSEIHEMLAARTDANAPAFELSLGVDQILAQIDLLQRQRTDIEQAIAELRQTHERLAGATNSSGALASMSAERQTAHV
jgi:DNA-binding transcriptional MerR regulator